MSREKAAAVLTDNVKAGAICGDIVNLLIENYEQVDHARDEFSHIAGKRYFESLG